MRRAKRKTIMIFVALFLLLLLAGGLFTGNYFYELALNPKSDRSTIFAAPHNSLRQPQQHSQQQDLRREYEDWLARMQQQELTLLAEDGLKLWARFVDNETAEHRWAILCHGYDNLGSGQMLVLAQGFHQLGYRVLLPDARGHGASEGDYIGMGWLDRLDVLAWVAQVLEQDAEAEIVLYGISMGAATVMMAAGEDLPANVKAIIEDCGYTSAWAEFTYQCEMLYGLPAFPFMHFSSLVTRLRAGYWLGEASALQQVARSETPILFIHGSADTFVPASMMEELYAAAAGEKQRLLVEGAGHGQSATTDPQLYWQTVADFLQQYI